MRGSRIRLYLTRLMVVCILVALATGAAHWSDGHPIAEASLFTIGLALSGIGAAGRAWATSYISGQKLKQLVMTGPYSMCRNPLYFFSLVLGVGIAFCTETFTMPAIVAVGLLSLYYFQIRNEQRRMLAKFGAQYKQYLATVPCFIPSYRSFNEPDEITISPRLLKRGFFGVAFLLLLIGLLELLEALHKTGWLPVFYPIY